MNSLPVGCKALVVGASGALGGAFVTALQARPGCAEVVALSRGSMPAVDVEDETRIAAAAATLRERGPFHLIVNATGALHIGTAAPEKRLAELNAGPRLRHQRDRAGAVDQAFRTVVADQGARPVRGAQREGRQHRRQPQGRLGYSYRAAKAAQNMLVKSAAIEIARSRPAAVITALHPGTVRSRLSAPIIGDTLAFEPAHAVGLMLAVPDGLSAEQSGGFFAYDGSTIDW